VLKIEEISRSDNNVEWSSDETFDEILSNKASRWRHVGADAWHSGLH